MLPILWAMRPHLGATRPRVGILVGRRLLNAIQRIALNARVESVKSCIVVFKPLIVLMDWFIFDILSENR